MKKKIILSSIITIAICLCLVVGSTFALFTDSTEIEIVVSSANVDLEAELGDIVLYSAKGDANGTLVDENGKTYVHEKQTNKFSNGGTASYDEDANKLTIDKITPGDKIEFPLAATNSSDVAIQYRFVIKCTDADTAKALTKGTDPMFFTVNGNKLVVDSENKFVSEWETLIPGENMEDVTITFELPITAGNEYQGLKANFMIIVEAVQANGVVDGPVDDDDNNVIETGTMADAE